MGMYEYTLRADTKVVDGIEIGHYGYAYKHGWDYHADSPIPSVRRSIRAQYAAAEKAKDKLDRAGVRHVVQATKWSWAEDSAGLTVFRVDGGLPDSFTENMPKGTIMVTVGAIFANPSRWLPAQ